MEYAGRTAVESFLVIFDVITPPSGGRVSLLVIASLVMSGCHAGSLHHQLCDVDEFYDAVVDDCARCSDVCDLCLAPESQSFCVRNCPDFYAKMQASQTGCAPTRKLAGPVTAQSRQQQDASHPQASGPSSWSSNPLIWTTVVSLSVAVVATIVIVPLVVCVQVRQRCTGKPVPGAPGAARQKDSSSLPAAYSSVENGTVSKPSDLPTSPICVPHDGLDKEKSEPLLISGVC